MRKPDGFDGVDLDFAFLRAVSARPLAPGNAPRCARCTWCLRDARPGEGAWWRSFDCGRGATFAQDHNL